MIGPKAQLTRILGGSLIPTSSFSTTVSMRSGPSAAKARSPASIGLTTLAAAAIGGGLAYYFSQNSASVKMDHSTFNWNENLRSDANAPAALKSDSFVQLKLKKILPYNHNSAVYSFELPKDHKSGLTVTSCVLFKGEVMPSSGEPGAKSQAVVRPYTPISAPDTLDQVDFLIKKYDTGKLTPHLASLQPGDVIQMKGPLPKFPYRANQFDDIAFIAGGTGITPHYQLIQQCLSDKNDKTKMTLLYGNVSSKDILLKEKFDAWARDHPDQFKVVYFIDKPETAWTGETGFMSRESLAKYLPPASMSDKVKVFVCGPPPLYNSISGGKVSPSDQGELSGALKELGFKKDQVYKF